MTIRQAFRISIDPTPPQEELLLNFTGATRFWFNQGLALVKDRLDRRAAGEDVRVPWSYKALCSEFAPIKDDVCPWRSEVVVGSQQAGLEQLGNALQNFSKARRAGRRVGFPRFRTKGRSREVVLFQRPRLSDTRHVNLDRRLGAVRTKEPLKKLIRLLASDPRARVVRSTVTRDGRRWFISFQVERSAKRRRARRPAAAVGVDLGLVRLATLSTGQTVDNSRPLQRVLDRLRRSQRQLDRQRRASNPSNYLLDGRVKSGPRTWHASRRMARTQDRIRRLHERAANLRREQAHQLTTALVREFGVIGVEGLAIKNLFANARLSRHLADVAWGMILNQLAYKTSWSEGSLLVVADRFHPSSKTCSVCGSVKAKLNLGERVFHCDDPACRQNMDRDLNAAMNLAHIAVRQTQAEGLRGTYVARTGRETLNARRGQVRPIDCNGLSPMKREGSAESSQCREALALAI